MNKEKTNRLSPLKRFLIIFLITFASTLVITGYILSMSLKQKQERAEHFANMIGSETYEMMLSQLSKTQVLEAYLVQSNGIVETNAEEIAEILLREEEVRNILFAPNGVVEYVYPLESNEEVLGLNMYEDGLGNWEAQAAIEANELYMAGPFELLQGGIGIAGRLPVYLHDENGDRYFWGIVSVTLDFPEILENSSIQYLNAQGYACEIWRIVPTTQKKETVLETEVKLPQTNIISDYNLTMFNAEWTVSVAPVNPWYADMSLWLCLGLGFLVSFFVALNAYNKEKLWLMEQKDVQRQINHLQKEVEFEQNNMLLSQIRSHFFYHTLNSVQALILFEPENAYEMIDNFSSYIRFNLDSITVENGLCTFKQELRAVQAYTNINQKQLDGRLNVVYDIPNINFNIPVLTIQPVVENAILHGIKPKAGGGTVTVQLKECENCMTVIVEDDGVGFDISDETLDQSVGMKNVRKRLNQFPGCTIQFESHPLIGTKVILIYPKDL